jgi:serine/threonine protein kinase
MLVARFPEFDHQPRDHLLLKLPPTLWQDKTPAAKNLLLRLMCYEPDRRMTAAEALRHEWLQEYRWVDIEAARPEVGVLSGVGDGLEKAPSLLSEKQSCDESIGGESTSSESQYISSTISLRPAMLLLPHLQQTFSSQMTPRESQGGYQSKLHLPLLLLLQLQR